MSTQPFTIPSLPDHLDSALREKAAAEKNADGQVFGELIKAGKLPGKNS